MNNKLICGQPMWLLGSTTNPYSLNIINPHPFMHFISTNFSNLWMKACKHIGVLNDEDLEVRIKFDQSDVNQNRGGS